MRVLYLGTPAFAVPTLEKLIAWPQCQVIGVVTQPDRPAGRGNKMQPPPTKVMAEAHGIPVLQPERLSKAPEIVEQMREMKPDILVMVAFGQILRKAVLEMAPLGVLNLHGSLLPKYRGAAPINWAIIDGETVTGATTMFSDAGVDTGAMLLKCEIPITPTMTAPELAEIMSRRGGELMIETLEAIRDNMITPLPQDDSQATMAPMLKKEMGIIDWTKSAIDLNNLIRGLLPWPGTQTHFQGAPLKVLRSAPPPSDRKQGLTQAPGSVVAVGETVEIACGPLGQETLSVLEVQPANKARMKARDWANGVRLQIGAVLG